MNHRTRRGPDRLRRHGRTAVTALIATWLLSQAGLAAVVEWSGTWLRDPLYADKELKLRRRIAARSAAGRPWTLVMLGSSRTANGLDGLVLEAALDRIAGRPSVAFNFGVPAAGPVTSALYLHRLLAAGCAPDLVLIEVLPAHLDGRSPEPVEAPFLLPQRLRVGEVRWAVEHGFPANPTWSGWWCAETVPWSGLRFPLLGRAVARWLPWNLRFDSSRGTDAAGWQRSINESVTHEQHRQGVLRARAEYYDRLQGLAPGGPAARALDESVELCRRHGVRVALVLMPEGTDFRAWYQPGVERELLRFLAGRDAPLVDARRWLDDEQFCDAHHLLPGGARQFTERLAEAVAGLLRDGNR
jgi:hypothetical protein